MSRLHRGCRGFKSLIAHHISKVMKETTKIIEVTKCGTSEKVLVNIQYITNVFPTQSTAGVRYSDIYFTNGASLPISETVEEVKDLIDVAL